MVAVIILTGGLCLIFKSYLTSLKVLNHIQYRLHAHFILDQSLTEITKFFQTYHEFPQSVDDRKYVINKKLVNFRILKSIQSLEALPDIYALEVKVRWQEGNQEKVLSRSTYVNPLLLLEQQSL